MLEEVIKSITKHEPWGLHFLPSVQSFFSSIDSNEQQKMELVFGSFAFLWNDQYRFWIVYLVTWAHSIFLTPLSTLRLKVQAKLSDRSHLHPLFLSKFIAYLITNGTTNHPVIIRKAAVCRSTNTCALGICMLSVAIALNNSKRYRCVYWFFSACISKLNFISTVCELRDCVFVSFFVNRTHFMLVIWLFLSIIRIFLVSFWILFVI